MKQYNMKKILVLSLFSILIMGVHAQGRFELGVKAGLNLSDVNMTNNFDVDWSSSPNVGFAYGIFGKVKITKKLAFQPELYFANKEYIFKEVDNSYDPTLYSRHHNHLNEWDVPLLLTYDIKKIKDKYDLFVLLGPEVATKVKYGKYENIKSQDPYWNGVAGVGLRYWRVTADLRYERNLYDFYKHIQGTRDRTLNANVLSFHMSFNFLGKRELKREYKVKKVK